MDVSVHGSDLIIMLSEILLSLLPYGLCRVQIPLEVYIYINRFKIEQFLRPPIRKNRKSFLYLESLIRSFDRVYGRVSAGIDKRNRFETIVTLIIIPRSARLGPMSEVSETKLIHGT